VLYQLSVFILLGVILTPARLGLRPPVRKELAQQAVQARTVSGIEAANPRIPLWLAALRAWSRNKIFGIGPNVFKEEFLDYVPDARLRQSMSGMVGATNTHNAFLEFLAGGGSVAFVLLSLSGYYVAKALLEKKSGGFDAILVLPCALVLMLDNLIYFYIFSLTSALILAAAVAEDLADGVDAS